MYCIYLLHKTAFLKEQNKGENTNTQVMFLVSICASKVKIKHVEPLCVVVVVFVIIIVVVVVALEVRSLSLLLFSSSSSSSSFVPSVSGGRGPRRTAPRPVERRANQWQHDDVTKYRRADEARRRPRLQPPQLFISTRSETRSERLRWDASICTRPISSHYHETSKRGVLPGVPFGVHHTAAETRWEEDESESDRAGVLCSDWLNRSRSLTPRLRPLTPAVCSVEG